MEITKPAFTCYSDSTHAWQPDAWEDTVNKAILNEAWELLRRRTRLMKGGV